MSDEPLLKRSIHTERALSLPRPRLRGRSHLYAAILAVPSAVLWVALAPAGARLAVAAFGAGIATMFTCSALLHLRPRDARSHERLLRLDHTGIFLAIAGTGVAIGLLGMPPVLGRALVLVMLLGAGIGIVVEWLPFAPPRGFNNAVYLSLGWIPIMLVPWLWAASGTLVVALLAVGGFLYTSGAIIVGLRRPDPSPIWFGYHELFHVLVIGAVAAHAAMIALLVQRVG